MVLPGGPATSSVRLAIAPTDLRQLAEHDARPRTFDGDAGPLAALDTGARATPGTVLLVAGYTGCKEDFAPLLAPLAAAGYRAVALDQRGQNESPGPDDPDAYTVAELGKDVLIVGSTLRAVSDGPLHLVGHSFGGLVCRSAVLADAGMFDSLTLLGSGPGALSGHRADLLDHLAPLLDAGGVPAVQATLDQLAMTDPKAMAIPEETRAFQSAVFLRNNESGLRGMAAALLGEPDRVAELATAGVPVLVAHGEADDAWTPAAQADMARRLGARYEVIPGSIHSPAIENPPGTLRVLLEFWSSLRGVGTDTGSAVAEASS